MQVLDADKLLPVLDAESFSVFQVPAVIVKKQRQKMEEYMQPNCMQV